MLGRRPAASPQELHTLVNEPLGVFRHVIRRGHVHLPAVHLTRKSGICLRRDLPRRDGSHFLDGVEHDVRSDRAIEPDDVRASGVQSLGNGSRRVAVNGPAVVADGHLRHHGERADVPDGDDGLLDLRDVGHRFEDEQIDAGIAQRLGLLPEKLARFLQPGGTVRLDADSQRPDGSGHVGGVSGRLPGNLHRFLIDGTQLVFDSEGAQLDAIRSVGVGLQDLSACAHVLLVYLEHDLRVSEVELVVTLVDEHALRIEHGAHRPIEQVDMLVSDGVDEILHEVLDSPQQSSWLR